jgi:hypothetical protein
MADVILLLMTVNNNYAPGGGGLPHIVCGYLIQRCLAAASQWAVIFGDSQPDCNKVTT